MVSMKMGKEEQDEQNGVMAEKPEYPYGLQLNLDDETMAKLGLALPEVGKEFLIVAKVKVCSASSYEREGSEKEDSCSLQITEMEIGPDKSESNAAAKLYGKA